MPAEPHGVVRNTGRINGRVRDARRMRGLEHAAEIVGGQGVLADAMGIGARELRKKIAAERPIHDEDLRLAASAVSAHALKADEHASRLTALLDERVLL